MAIINLSLFVFGLSQCYYAHAIVEGSELGNSKSGGSTKASAKSDSSIQLITRVDKLEAVNKNLTIKMSNFEKKIDQTRSELVALRRQLKLLTLAVEKNNKHHHENHSAQIAKINFNRILIEQISTNYPETKGSIRINKSQIQLKKSVDYPTIQVFSGNHLVGFETYRTIYDRDIKFNELISVTANIPSECYIDIPFEMFANTWTSSCP